MTLEKYNELTSDSRLLINKQVELFNLMNAETKSGKNRYDILQEELFGTHGMSESQMKQRGCEVMIAGLVRKHIYAADELDMNYLLAYALVQMPETYPKIQSLYNKDKREYETVRLPENFKYYGLSIRKITYFQYVYKILICRPAMFAQLFSLFRSRNKELAKEITNYDWYIKYWIGLAAAGLYEPLLVPMLFMWGCDISYVPERFRFMRHTLIIALYIMEQAFKNNYELPSCANDFFEFLKRDDIKNYDDIKKFENKYRLRWENDYKPMFLMQYLVRCEPRFANTDVSGIMRMAGKEIYKDNAIDKLLPSSSETNPVSEELTSYIEVMAIMFSGLQKQYADDIDYYLANTKPVVIREPDTKAQAELENVKARLEETEKELIRKKQETERLNTTIAEIKREKEGSRRLESENRKLKDRISELEESLGLVQKEFREFQECMFDDGAEPKTDAETGGGIDLDALKAVVVGGHPNWASKYKQQHTNWTFYEIEQVRFDAKAFRNADCVIIVTAHMSHSVYEKVISLCRLYKKKLIYINSVNSIEKCDDIVKNAMAN